MSARPWSSYLLVAGQLLALGLSCVPFGRDQAGGVVAVGCIAAGMVLGVVTLCYNRIGNFSIFPEPLAAAKLIVAGPYSRIRHPMYAALALMTLGVSLYNGAWPNGLAWLVLLGVLVAKIRREERHLVVRFPQYAAYRSRTARLVPGIW